MIKSEDVKELEKRLSKEYRLEIHRQKTKEMLKKNSSEKEIKETDKFVHMGSVVEKNG
jgi:hypothetical protein